MTAVELLPVHHIADEQFLVERGPDELLGLQLDRLPRAARAATPRPARAASRCASSRAWSRRCTAPGIEVILDVVYNHTAEGNHLGPMLSFKGVDNASYYRLVPDDPRFYMDFTGTGNSLNPVHPSVLRLIMDSLRYLVDRVPRRRLPLRPRLGARARVLRRRPALGVLRRHPPGPGALAGQADRRAVGRRPGRLPGRQLPGALERSGTASTATRCATSGAARRSVGRLRRRASPARATSTQADGRHAVRVDQLHHRARRLHARATSSPTTTSTTRRTTRTTATAPTTTARWNCGVEGATDDPEINALRARQQRNFLATLLLSQGVPMLLGGDEIGRTQGGNNNAWCQDNEISWFDWELDAEPRRAARLHAAADRAAPRAPGLPPRARSSTGAPVERLRRCPTSGGSGPTAASMTRARLAAGGRARARRVPQRRGDRRRRRRDGERDRRRLVPAAVQRPPRATCEFTLPPRRFGSRWTLELSTRPTPRARRGRRLRGARPTCRSTARSIVLLRRP